MAIVGYTGAYVFSHDQRVLPMRLFTPFEHATPLVQLLRRLYAWSVDTLLVCALLGAVLLLAICCSGG